MEGNNLDISNLPIRKAKRKFTRITQYKLVPSKTKRVSTTIDQGLIQLYKSRMSYIKKQSYKEAQKLRTRSVDGIMIMIEPSIANSQRLPAIYTPKSNKSKIKSNIQGREDKLNALINNFLDESVNSSKNSEKFKYNSDIDLDDSKKHQENLFYEKNLEMLRGQEFVDYQNDIEKNLKIEKIRLRNYKRNKLRLKSV